MAPDLEFATLLLRTLGDSVPHRIYAKDRAGRFVFANAAVAQGMGVATAGDLLGRTDHDFYPEADAAAYTACEQQIMESGRALINAEEHVTYLRLDRSADLLTTKVPLRDDDGRVIGIVGINYDVTAIKEAERALRQARDEAELARRQLQGTVERLNLEVSHRVALEEQLRRQALHDPLTGLPNRALLLDRLEQAMRLGQRSGLAPVVAFIDLDGFKQINDRLGHEAGDVLLETVARRMLDCIRMSDTLGRIGGDEFALVLPASAPPQALDDLMQRIATSVSQPTVLAGETVCMSCSIGHALMAPGDDARALLRHADAAMYVAKQAGGNTVRAYEAAAPPAPARSEPL